MKTEIDRDLFRHRLYELMVEQNLSQYDLAREMRISVSALNNWLNAHLERALSINYANILMLIVVTF